MDSRVCERCGGGMLRKNRQARFCSTRCRVAAHRANHLPAAMTSRDRWIRRTASKRPITVDGRSASSTDSATWSSFAAASRSSAGAGLGFILGDGVGCFDLDHCLIDGELAGWARDAIAAISEPILFAEVSQSGDGVHVFVEAPEGRGTRIRDGRNIEFYSWGRYIAVTGKRFSLPS